MSRSVFGRNRMIVVVGLVAALLAVPGVVSAENRVKIAPHRIVLNAKGQSDGIDAIVGIWLPSSAITEYEAILYLVVEDDPDNPIPIASVVAVRYCAVDDNLFVTFDREEIQNNPYIIACAGQTVRFWVDGSVTVGGDVYEFSGGDEVDIHDPGR